MATDRLTQGIGPLNVTAAGSDPRAADGRNRSTLADVALPPGRRFGSLLRWIVAILAVGAVIGLFVAYSTTRHEATRTEAAPTAPAQPAGPWSSPDH